MFHIRIGLRFRQLLRSALSRPSREHYRTKQLQYSSSRAARRTISCMCPNGTVNLFT